MTARRRGRAPLAALLHGLLVGGCTMVGAPGSPPPAAEPVGPGEPPVAPSGERVVDQEDASPATPEALDGHELLRPVRVFDEVRALWVVRSTMTSEAEVRAMVRSAAAAGFNTILVQVRGRGDAFYRSALEPRAETLLGAADFDPLALAVEEGHAHGLAVHAWVNTHLVWGPTAPPRSPEHLVNARPDWLAVPRALGRELYDVPPDDPRFFEALRTWADRNRATVEGVYTSPSHPAVQDRVHAVWMELLDRYDLDGIHFDYIRFPSGEFDYSRGALERFRLWLERAVAGTPTGVAGTGAGSGAGPAETRPVAADPPAGVRGAEGGDPYALVEAYPDAWADFRREQITGLVRRIYTDVKARRPEVVVSAAVIADAEDAYRHRFQDWRRWLEEGILDIAVPMAYTTDGVRFSRQVADARLASGSRRRTWAGIGAYLNGFEGTLDKIDLARAEDVGGLVLFSYDWAVETVTGEDPETFLERVGRARFGSR